jgi:hypothetical protein
MMVRRGSACVETYVVGTEASKILSGITGVTAVTVENQYGDRATLSYDWKADAAVFDSRLNFDEIDRQLQSRGMHRMQ